MKRVILTIGTRAAGKTTRCREVLQRHPDVAYISQDEVILERLGKTSLDRYTNDYEVVMAALWRKLGKELSAPGPKTIILDCWNGYANERKRYVREIRRLGADEVIGWYFMLPKDTCAEWFAKREDNGTMRLYDDRIAASLHDHQLYYSEPVDLGQGFDQIETLCVLQPVLPGMPFI